jgi:hypothetical protein
MGLFNSIGNFLGKAADIITDIVPGGNMVQDVIETIVPESSNFFAGTMNTGSTSGTVPSASVATVASSGGQPMSLPVLSGPVPTSMAAVQTETQAGAGGLPVPWWKGPGGKLQLPWNDPKIAAYLKQFALDDSYLKITYRAPKGFVVVRDASGRPYCLAKPIAKQFGLWKPSAKPPISATDWKHYKRNKAIEKKLRKVAAPVIREATSRARRAAATKKRK